MATDVECVCCMKKDSHYEMFHTCIYHFNYLKQMPPQQILRTSHLPVKVKLLIEDI